MTLPEFDKSFSILEPLFNALHCVYWKDRNGYYHGANQNELDTLGLSSLADFIGKTIFEIVDDQACARAIEENDQKVMQEVRTLTIEEKLVMPTGDRYYLSQKSPIHDKNGEVIGLFGFSVEITEQKRKELAIREEKEAEQLRQQAERLQHENEIETQRLIIEEKENFAKLARKVAHDINSPLAALNMMLDVCNELPEDKRAFLRRATESILDIANNLLTNNDKEENLSNAEIEFRDPVLVSDLLIHLLSEKKVQYQHYTVKFETIFANDAQFAFIQVQKTEFRRAMSNLINNAVDALDKGERTHRAVTVHLTASADFVFIKVQDTGKGMHRDQMGKIIARRGFTEGKENGHGLGLQQVWDMLECNDGTMSVESELGQGTSVQLAFPRIPAPKWIAQEIHLHAKTIVVILDDDESIHTAWNLRFNPFFATHPNIRLQHFMQGQEALDFFEKFQPEEKNHVIFLSDYELLDQDRNGLQIMEASKIKDAILVTSYYSQPRLRDAATRLNVKILPKQMASIIPICLAQTPQLSTV